MKPVAKTLYPTNFPEHSLAALPYAIALSRQFQAEWSCLRVIDEGNEGFLRSKCITPLVAAPLCYGDGDLCGHRAAIQKVHSDPSLRGGEPED